MPTPEQVATDAHAAQVDKAGLPYIEHPRRVAARVAAQTDAPDAVAAAWLHAVVEDIPVGLERVVSMRLQRARPGRMEALTRRSGDGDDYYRRVAANAGALLVERADTSDNTDPGRESASS